MLKYISDYTGFSGDTELQSGNYLAIHCEDENADNITIELVGGQDGPKQLDSDGIAIFRITSTTQSIKIVADEGGKEVARTFSLFGVTLEV